MTMSTVLKELKEINQTKNCRIYRYNKKITEQRLNENHEKLLGHNGATSWKGRKRNSMTKEMVNKINEGRKWKGNISEEGQKKYNILTQEINKESQRIVVKRTV